MPRTRAKPARAGYATTCRIQHCKRAAIHDDLCNPCLAKAKKRLAGNLVALRHQHDTLVRTVEALLRAVYAYTREPTSAHRLEARRLADQTARQIKS